MNISLQQVSKRFQQHWIFKQVSYEFSSGNAYALLGANGSGKSTLLRVIAGMQAASKGSVVYTDGNSNVVNPQQAFRNISFTAPGQEIIEELTMREFLDFHFSFKKPLQGLRIDDIIALTGLQAAADKPLGDYSSGMKQRVKLAQAIFSDTEVLMVDEPCTNLDEAGTQQYRNWMEAYSKNRLVLVASNDVREYFFCKDKILLEDYK
jgi:ABC-type multidrug transport system ATPase subunit